MKGTFLSLSVLISQGEFGGDEAAQFLAVRHQLRRSPEGTALGWGFTLFGLEQSLTSLSWWPVGGL